MIHRIFKITILQLWTKKNGSRQWSSMTTKPLDQSWQGNFGAKSGSYTWTTDQT